MEVLFPTLQNKKFGYVNLDAEARIWIKGKGLDKEKKNPLLDPKMCQEMVLNAHKKYKLDFSYGGWMEDRSFLWKGSYLRIKQNFIHLGIDCNVPAGTEVAVPFDAEVVKIDDDHPEEGGWGPRVIMRHLAKGVYFIFAHLDRDISCKVGDTLKAGTIFAKVGKAPFNGNWFPHLHVQTVSKAYYDELEKSGSWSDLDGYGLASQIELNAERFRDPISFLA